MASISDEENIHQEETGRRTRSGRKVTVPTTPPPARTPRRSSRRQTGDQMNEVATDSRIKPVEEDTFLQSEIIQEMLAEAAQGVLVHSTESEDLVTNTIPATYDTDSINDNEVHEDVQEEIITNMEMVEQELDGEEILFVSETQETDDIIMETQGSEYVVLSSQEEEEEMYANTQESDGNYIQVSGAEEVILQSQGTEEGIVPHTQEIETIIIHRQEQEPEEIIINTQEPEENITQTEDDKSSSFPFGNIPASENSDGKTEEIVVSNITDCVDSSLLASLVGDNANSLPSAGEESQSKDNFENTESIKETGMKITLETDDTHSQPAIAEDLQNGGDAESEKTGADVDADMVSEDEFPTRVQPKVTDAEEVSDDELPAPTRAELPADTEVVSEDELPASTKKEISKRKASEGYDPGSPTEESVEVPEKKTKLTAEEKEEAKEKKKEKEKRKLPELEKYWNAVNEDPADFTGWTYLLQYVDQENDIEAAREAYDAFLAHYPYCYGYWRKYADYEKRKGNKKKCEEVFERGLKAIPLSVDLWIHYLTHVKTNFVDNEEYVRSQFERALSACGLEFRSDKLWEAFIKWEMEAKRYSKVLKIYDRLLKTPTQGYSGHFDSFQDLINNQSISSTISIEEFKKVRSEIRESEKTGDKETVDEEDEADDHVRNDEEATAIRDKIIALRRKVHKVTVSAVTARWTFEEGIKRPYFHVKPLERCQLKNWNEYLDYEIERGDRKRVLILFERCLIACALYDEFWLKLIRYLELQNDLDLTPATRDAFERACTIHHPDKPSLHLMWSAFEECQNNFNKAAEILVNVEKIAPNLLQIAYRRINLERRRGDLEKCKELYEYYISQAKNKNIAGSLAIKYARFCHKIMEDLEAGLNVLRLALEKDPANTRVALQMIDLALQRHQVNEDEVVEIMDNFMSRDGMEPDQKVLFAQRKVEFLEDFGSTAKGLQDAQRALHIALNKANESKKKSESSPSKKSTSKDTTPPASVSNSATSAAYNNGSYGYGSSTNSNYYGNNQSYPSYDSYGYNHWQQQYGTGYSGGYSQWSGYGNYY